MLTPVKVVRFWLPFLIFVAGATMLIVRPDIIGIEGAALMLGGGLGVIVSNRIHRMGLASEKDRLVEMSDRAFMRAYGVWPEDASPEILAQAERDGNVPAEAPSPTDRG